MKKETRGREIFWDFDCHPPCYETTRDSAVCMSWAVSLGKGHRWIRETGMNIRCWWMFFGLVPLPSVEYRAAVKWRNKKHEQCTVYKRLTFHQRGWRRGWRGCCPCPPGNALVRRKSVVCSEWRTAVSPGWCPGGLGSPRTGRWCDRLPADSSLDPCSPRGHLTRSNKRRRCQTHCINLTHRDIIHFDCCFTARAYPRDTWFILKYVSTPQAPLLVFLFLI